MSTSTGAPAPVFSYAQAAKGLTPTTSTQTTSRNESPAASEKCTKDRLGSDAVGQPSVKLTKSLSDSDGKQVTEPISNPSHGGLSKDVGERESCNSTQHSYNPDQEDKSLTVNGSSSPDQSAHPDEARPSLHNGRMNSSDLSQDLSLRDKSVGDKRSKEVDDDWEKVSVPSIPAEKELKAAPIPTVNIWKQRQEAQAAKFKDIQDQQRSPVSGSLPQVAKPKSAHDDTKQKPSNRDGAASEKDGKAIDNSRSVNRKDTPARTPRPMSQQSEKGDAENPPAVGDAQSWPTPENSTADERRKSTSYEKVDKPDGKFAVQKSHGKNWVQVPFVPSAKFETQLPPSAARRGGRGGNRGRESGSRGGHSSGTSDKQDTTGLMGPPPVPRHSGEQDRGRRADGNRGPRGASDPSTSTRPAIGDDNTSASHKQAVPFAKPTAPDAVSAAGPSVQNGDEHQKTEESSRSSSRHAGHANARPLNGDPINQNEQTTPGYGNNDQNTRSSYTLDRFKASAGSVSRGNAEFGKDRGIGRNREWSRDKPEPAAREKVESWRDRESSGDQNGRRDARSERGRGTGYRGGRGNHSYNQAYPPSHPFTAPLPQNGFDPPRSISHTETRSRQSSQPFQPTQSATGSRNNPRSQSIPVQMASYPGYFNASPNVGQGLPFLQTDLGYHPIQMQPGIMTAIPYNDPLNSFALMSMVITQIEYYFSIDNLCKDVFLRKHMDSQGWVPLSVIANFKRIKTLTEDNMTLETVRYVCQTVKSIEFLPGLDGDDRLRRRENWRDFVLPYEERFESARHDGPVPGHEHYIHLHGTDQAPSIEGSLPLGQLRSQTGEIAPTNGMYHTSSPMTYIPGAPTEPQLFNGSYTPALEDASTETSHRPSLHSTNSHSSSTVRSPPPHAAGPPSGLANGHHRHSSRSDIEANFFPDENIPNINIRMQPRTIGATPEGEVRQKIARVASNESAVSQGDPSNSEKTRLPSLRGGAGSPQQLESLHSISFGYSNGVPMTDESSVIYFTKDGQETHLPPPRPGQYDQTYLSLHEVAFQQKELGVDGALEPLYSFWTDFLADKFNSGMYDEFKSTALSEAAEGHSGGVSHLNHYYAKLLSGTIPVSERLAGDMVALAREEKGNDRPLFHILRAAWRNGATNMKTIKRLGDFFTVEEKAQLEKSA